MLPLTPHSHPTTAGSKDGHVHGMVALSGSVLALCLAMPRDPFSRVLHDLRVDAVRSVVSRLDVVQDGEEEQAEQGERDEAEGGGKERGAGGELKGNAREGGEEEEKTDKVEEEEETERPLLKGKLHRTPFTRWHLPRRVLLRCSVAGGGGRRGGSEGEEEGEGGLLLADYCEMGERAKAAEDRCGELCGMAAVADEAMREQGIGVEWEGQVEEGEEEQSGMEGSAAPAAVWLPPGTALAKPHSSTRPGSSGSSDTSAVKGQVGEKGSAGRAVSLLLAVLGVLLALIAALLLALK
ncbi:unnamed protein product [Closterium sp. NIES-54]